MSQASIVTLALVVVVAAVVVAALLLLGPSLAGLHLHLPGPTALVLR